MLVSVLYVCPMSKCHQPRASTCLVLRNQPVPLAYCLIKPQRTISGQNMTYIISFVHRPSYVSDDCCPCTALGYQFVIFSSDLMQTSARSFSLRRSWKRSPLIYELLASRTAWANAREYGSSTGGRWVLKSRQVWRSLGEVISYTAWKGYRSDRQTALRKIPPSREAVELRWPTVCMYEVDLRLLMDYFSVCHRETIEFGRAWH